MSRLSLRIFVTIVATAALVLGVFVFRHYGGFSAAQSLEAWGGLTALIAVVIIAEVAGLRFSAGRVVLSAALIPIVATVPLFGPAVAVAATALSETVARLTLREPPIKSLFNISQLTLTVAAASLVYVWLGGPVSLEEFHLQPTLLPFGGLVIVYFLSNTGLVSTVVALDSGKAIPAVWKEVGTVGLANDLASSSLALFVVYAFTELGIEGLLLILLPLLFVHHSYGVYLRLQKQNTEILEFLVKTIEAKDPYTSGHSQRVAKLSKEIAEAMGLPTRKTNDIEIAALLHDIGKIDFSYNDVISSSAPLSATDREIIRSHPIRGEKLLASISSLNPSILEAVRHHHEHYDGGGYPDQLTGEEIPLSARVIMVADTVDAMLSNRPYRPALTVNDVRRELERFSGKQFDPRIVRAFLTTGLVQRALQRAEADRTPVPAGSPTRTREVSLS